MLLFPARRSSAGETDDITPGMRLTGTVSGARIINAHFIL
jgi:hypothetical protein